MFKNIARGFGKFISIIGKILLLSLICLALGALIVFPLWKWASSFPTAYSWFMLALILAAAVLLCISRFRKKGAARFFVSLAKLAVILGGLSASVCLVLGSNRTAAIVVFISTFAAYGILASVSSSILNGKKGNPKNRT